MKFQITYRLTHPEYFDSAFLSEASFLTADLSEASAPAALVGWIAR